MSREIQSRWYVRTKTQQQQQPRLLFLSKLGRLEMKSHELRNKDKTRAKMIKNKNSEEPKKNHLKE
jgi:hypothetical protein